MNYDPAKNTRTAKMGRKSEAALYSLNAHGPQTRLQIEYRLTYGPMADAMARLRDLGLARCVREGNVCTWQITHKGLVHLGVATQEQARRIERVNSFSSREPYDPARHHTGRVGLAVYSTPTRFTQPSA